MGDREKKLKLAKAKLKLQSQQPKVVKNVFGQTGTEVNATSKAVALGTIDAIPGLKQGAAGLETVVDTANDVIENSDVSIEGVYEGYQQNLAETQTAIDRSRKNNPVAFGVGEFGTTMALSAVAGPLNVGRQIALGAAQGFSRHHSLTDSMWQAGWSGIFSGLGIAVPKGIDFVKKKVGPALADIADQTSLSVIKPRAQQAIVKKTKALVDKRYKGNNAKAAADVEEIVDLPLSHSPTDMANRALENKNKYGQRIMEIVDDVDEEMIMLTGGAKTKSGGVLQAELKKAVDPTDLRFNRDHLDDVLSPSFKEIDDIIDDITLTKPKFEEEIFFPVERVEDPLTQGSKWVKSDVPQITRKEIPLTDHKFSAKEIFKMKVGLAKQVEDIFEKKLVQSGGTMSVTDRMVIREQKARIVGKLSDILDDQVRIGASTTKAPTTSTLGKIKGEHNANPLVDEFRDLNRKYGMASHVEEVTREVSRGSFEASAFKIGEAAVSFKGIFIAGGLGAAGGAPGFAAGVVINHLMKHPATPIKVARSLRKVQQYMTNNPTSKIASSFSTAFAGQTGESPEAMQQLIDNTIAKVNLVESPVERNKDDVIHKANSIASLLRQEGNNKIATDFLDAVQGGNEDEIGQIMISMAALPNSQKFIEPGVGWNGKVYSQQSKQMQWKELESSPISYKQKMELKKKLNLNNDRPGIIPKIVVEPPQQLQFQKRDKTKPKM